MSKFMHRAVAGALIAAFGLSAGAAQAAPANASATARAAVLKQITVANTSDLDFGTVVAGTSAANLDVSTAGARTCGAGMTCTGTVSAANFNITGTVASVVTISGDNSVSLSNGTDTMTASLTRSASTLTLAAGAVNGSFTVGGSLGVDANQADGSYTGTFNVSVDYQ
ncbi:DUF4402 domain-containing protein [Sphingomonas lacunae]|uniref:DUF4402 domain-containing protein n=1 Tax=Sphingomonas lacunae TaxID=2698828 RepID=A0A6M4AS35_9SPHN|nr:DUF4402 domain-containing protein [Sphingomonas lacunae]QJQ31853.1 DUF4402 domain-containing protein [Sphingomonas lacunae]